MILDFDPRPIWKKDAWWIIETHIVEDVSPFDDGIERIGEKIYFHKYRVVDEQQINGKDLWIIDIIAHKVPSEFTNDHGDNYLWRLYIDKENLTLSRFEMANRGQRYLVTGPEVQKTTYDFLNNKPVVISSVITLTPIDIPLLPSGDFPRQLSSNERDFEFINQDTSTRCWQHIDVIQEIINSKTVKALSLTLSGDEIGIRTQKWVNGLPWWQEWRCIKKKGVIRDLWYARLIEHE